MFQRTKSRRSPGSLQRSFPTSWTVGFPHIGLQVEKIGVGAHPQDSGKSDGIGLANFRSRVKSGFLIGMQPEVGTTGTIDAPTFGA
jgi:hypothetical protein